MLRQQDVRAEELMEQEEEAPGRDTLQVMRLLLWRSQFVRYYFPCVIDDNRMVIK